jgi:hypothetical protein
LVTGLAVAEDFPMPTHEKVEKQFIQAKKEATLFP